MLPLRTLPWLLLAFASLHAAPGKAPPKVLFFANPMTSDNDVARRTRPDVLSVAERNFQELSQGVFDVTITQDGAEVTAEKLTRYQAVVFFTAGNPPGVDKEGLIAWVKRGGAFIGLHSTANTFQGYAPFGEMLGAYYERRPWRTAQNPQTKIRVLVEDRTHPATRHLGESFPIADDIYQYKQFDRTKVQLLLRIDPASVDLAHPKFNRQDQYLPVAWARTHGAGRVFYTMLGDWEPTWQNPLYRKHLIEGIRWAMNATGEKP